jgi:hypothetical protein
VADSPDESEYRRVNSIFEQCLGSWKEIAAYLRHDLRTVQRWERERGLPIHRIPGAKRSGVFAYTEELDVVAPLLPGESSTATDHRATSPELLAAWYSRYDFLLRLASLAETALKENAARELQLSQVESAATQTPALIFQGMPFRLDGRNNDVEEERLPPETL